jgi:hypothetical protein
MWMTFKVAEADPRRDLGATKQRSIVVKTTKHQDANASETSAEFMTIGQVRDFYYAMGRFLSEHPE